jgi:hypothetical protein
MSNVKGGDKFKKVMDDMAGKIAKATTLNVGFLADAHYDDAAGTPVALVAATQEFGSAKRHIPPRPFFRGMIRDKSPEWGPLISDFLRKNNYDAELTLEQTGEVVAAQLQDAITEFVGVPLKPATIARKGFDKQLVDTSFMRSSANFVVKP